MSNIDKWRSITKNIEVYSILWLCVHNYDQSSVYECLLEDWWRTDAVNFCAAPSQIWWIMTEYVYEYVYEYVVAQMKVGLRKVLPYKASLVRVG